MPANYVLLGEYTTSVNTAFVTFSKIPQTGYTDLKVVISSRDDRSGQPNGDIGIQIGYNGTINTGSIYTMRRLGGSGASVFSDSSSTTSFGIGMSASTTATANIFGNSEFYIPNYTSSVTKYLSAEGVSENNATTAFAVINSGFMATNDPITDIKMFPYLASNFIANSTFSLYGIAALGTDPVISPKATGGDIVTNDGTYWYHAFLSSGIFTPSSTLSCDVLQVAGGGGGGYWNAGGGGAGGLNAFTAQSLTAINYPVTVGAGGNAGTSGGIATNGANSQFSSLTAAVGGGYGANDSAAGGSGGSGGGAGYGQSGGGFTSGQGTAGGAGDTTGLPVFGGGGGGAGVAGANGTSGNGAGGNGLSTYSSWGSATGTGQNVTGTYWYAGGGSGGNQTNTNTLLVAGGNGGGGSSGYGYNATVVNPTAGTANTGGGGGGGTAVNPGANGGSGIVIVRYTMA